MGSSTMRTRTLGVMGSLLTSGALTLLILAGCPAPADCPDRLRCPTAGGGADGADGHPSSTSSGVGASGDDGGEANDLCVPTDQGNIVPSSCGIFVRSEGDNNNPGTPDLPVKTLKKAAELAVGKGYVYACAQTFAENLTITTGLRLYGGLYCKITADDKNTEWVSNGVGGNPTALAPTSGIPLILTSGADGVHLSGFKFVAPDGVAPGGSSIAVLAVEAKGEIVRSELIAGIGVAGAEGSDASPSALAPNGGVGGLACSALSVAGGVGGFTNDCTDSHGGMGGAGGTTIGGAGSPGGPLSGGAGGKGDPGGGWTCALNNGEGDGHKGDDGGNGTSGKGGLSLGQLDAAGYHGADGDPGLHGTPGKGGGGGGGRSGPQCNLNKAGAGGGGGAPGGCGGKGGDGGKAGGSSIALVSVGSSLKLADVTLTSGNGGNGGRGGLGQPGAKGGTGGPGGAGTKPGCAGGDGGKGGDGGSGGGGRGGHSLGIAHAGTAPVLEGGTIASGMAGLGGPGSDSNNAGVAGVAVKVQKFD